MAKNKKPTKKYVPKPRRVPITAPEPAVDQKLIDDMTQNVHFALMALDHGGVSVDNWKRIAKVLMTVSFATDALQGIEKGHKVAIDSAVLTLKAVSDKEVRTGKWHVAEADVLSLKRGLAAAEDVMPSLSYWQLVSGYTTFRRLVNTIK